MATMKAVRAHTRGGPEVLVFEDAPVPPVGANDVLMKVYCAGITYTELAWDETWLRDGKPRTPIIPSHEASGVVAAVGTAVTDFAIGDEVFGLFPFDHDGAAAQFAAIPREWLAPKPRAVEHATAAALPLAALTAWQAVVDVGAIKAGDRLLVDGAAGAVGQFAVQLGSLMGASVTATARRADNDLVRSLGATEVITSDEAAAITPAAARFDLVVFARPGSPDESVYASIRAGGTLVTLNAPPSAQLAERHGIAAHFFIVGPDAGAMSHLAELVETGTLTVTIAAEFALSQAREAYERGARHELPPGKTILRVR